MSETAPICLTVRGELRYRETAVKLVAAACRLVMDGNRLPDTTPTDPRLDLSRPFDTAVVSAFSELFNNVAIHGYKGGAGIVTISVWPTQNAITLQLEDVGKAFDIDAVPEPKLETLPEGGMGIHIARSMVDDLAYTPGPPNRWRFTKSLESSEPSRAPTAQPTQPGKRT